MNMDSPLNKHTGGKKHADVCLVLPPFCSENVPSIALGILKSCLTREGISCHVDYANMYFHFALGHTAYTRTFYGSVSQFPGEYVFNEAAGINSRYSRDEFTSRLLELKDNRILHHYTKDLLEYDTAIIKNEIEKTADRILEYSPKLVGCSAIYQQRNASLAILKRIKEKSPETVTFMGGYECTGHAGISILQKFPFVDYIYFGESDDIIAPVTKNILEGGSAELPYGVLKNGGPYPEDPPYRLVEDMELVPAPDYDDFYDMLSQPEGIYMLQSNPSPHTIRLFLETSRGCWWGQKHPCTFCGLNGAIVKFRKKSCEKVLAEIDSLQSRYNPRFISFTDNIMPNEWFDSLLPELEGRYSDLTFVAEIKANMTEKQIEILSKAGYRILQPGIESLSDHMLGLMNKGVSAIQNIALLKYCKTHNIFPMWNIITCFPDEAPEDYTEQSRVVALIEHLYPPSFTELQYPKYCLYSKYPENYGITTETSDAFAYVSPDDDEYIKNISYYNMRTDTPKNPDLFFERKGLQNAIEKWNGRHFKMKSFLRLDMYKEDGKLYITDTRSLAIGEDYPESYFNRENMGADCAESLTQAKEGTALMPPNGENSGADCTKSLTPAENLMTGRKKILEGTDCLIYEAARAPISEKSLLDKICGNLAAASPGESNEAAIKAAIDRLCRSGLMVHIGDKYLALATEVSKEYSEEMDYQEFYRVMVLNDDLAGKINLEKTGPMACDLVKLAAPLGFSFTEETVRRENLTPVRVDMDL